MFTGIIESVGKVIDTTQEGDNLHLEVECPFTSELRIDQSISHNGVCLTLVDLGESTYRITAIRETLNRTTLKSWKTGTRINLERCMKADGRFDGHIVQGHVDACAKVDSIDYQNGSWLFRFSLTEPHRGLIVEKGSISVNGVSLTVVEVGELGFSVAIIPFTYNHTNFCDLKMDDTVNIEFDVVGKYIASMVTSRF